MQAKYRFVEGGILILDIVVKMWYHKNKLMLKVVFTDLKRFCDEAFLRKHLKEGRSHEKIEYDFLLKKYLSRQKQDGGVT